MVKNPAAEWKGIQATAQQQLFWSG